jgi:hypothetical protein
MKIIKFTDEFTEFIYQSYKDILEGKEILLKET